MPISNSYFVRKYGWYIGKGKGKKSQFKFTDLVLTFRWKFTLWAKIYDFYALSLWLWSRINWMEFLIFTANGLSRKNVKKNLAETSIWQTPRKLKLHGWSSYNTVSNEALLSENEDYLLQFHSSKCHYKILFLATDNEIVKKHEWCYKWIISIGNLDKEKVLDFCHHDLHVYASTQPPKKVGISKSDDMCILTRTCSHEFSYLWLRS